MLAATMFAGCFPHNARNRTIAEITEGAVAVTGIVIEGFVQSGADCDMNAHPPGEPPVQCKQDASIAGGIGVGLILAGLVGFIATISAAEDDDSKPKPIEIKAAPGPMIVVPDGNPPATPPPTPAPTPPSAPAPN
jgi:hypothetical protein